MSSTGGENIPGLDILMLQEEEEEEEKEEEGKEEEEEEEQEEEEEEGKEEEEKEKQLEEEENVSQFRFNLNKHYEELSTSPDFITFNNDSYKDNPAVYSVLNDKKINININFGIGLHINDAITYIPISETLKNKLVDIFRYKYVDDLDKYNNKDVSQTFKFKIEQEYVNKFKDYLYNLCIYQIYVKYCGKNRDTKSILNYLLGMIQDNNISDQKVINIMQKLVLEEIEQN